MADTTNRLQTTRTQELRDQPDQLASRLFVLLPPAAGGPTDDAYLDSRPADTELLVQVVGVLHRMLRVSPQSAQPSSAEARRVLSFFMNTLGNPQLPKPPPVDQMLSLSVLTPCYEEVRADCCGITLKRIPSGDWTYIGYLPVLLCHRRR